MPDALTIPTPPRAMIHQVLDLDPPPPGPATEALLALTGLHPLFRTLAHHGRASGQPAEHYQAWADLLAQAEALLAGPETPARWHAVRDVLQRLADSTRATVAAAAALPPPATARTETLPNGVASLPRQHPVTRPELLAALSIAAARGADARALWGTCCRLGFDRPAQPVLNAQALGTMLHTQGLLPEAITRASHQMDSAHGNWHPAAALLRSAAREMLALRSRARAAGAGA